MVVPKVKEEMLDLEDLKVQKETLDCVDHKVNGGRVVTVAREELLDYLVQKVIEDQLVLKASVDRVVNEESLAVLTAQSH